MPEFQRVAIVGVGLIGGSVGLALRKRELAAEVVGVCRRAESVTRAEQAGVVHRATTNLVDGVAEAEMIIVATPVESIVDTVLAVAQASPKGLITDAGSTKAEICRQLRHKPADGNDHSVEQLTRFVGSHPLAGDHRTGPEHARSDLYEGRTVVVTPEDDGLPAVVERVREFWISLGAEIVMLSPEEHDRALGATSHLPHLAAAALAAATPEHWLQLAATGWADTTRVAAADPGLWTQIFHQNREAVVNALRSFEHQLAAFGDALASGDDQTLNSLLTEAKRIRDALGD